MSFQVYISPILWGNHIMAWSKTRPTKAQGTDGNATPNKKELQAFLGIINYLGNYLLVLLTYVNHSKI